MYREVTGHYYKGDIDDVISNAEIIYRYNLLTPDNILRRARILFLERLIRKNAVILLTAACALQRVKRSWSCAVLADLAFLGFADSFECCKDLTLQQWIPNIRDMGKEFVK